MRRKMEKTFPFICLLLLFPLASCDVWQNLTKSRWDKKNAIKPPAESDLVNWSEKLALEEAEIEEMDGKIRKLVQKSNQAGALSWKIARGYMRSGSFEMGSKYYKQAIGEELKNQDFEIHNFESALPYFEKAMLMVKLDKQLLYEAAIAFANASKDMGWEPERRKRAIGLFKQLARMDPKDTRFPFQLALIYFDSSLKGEAWSGKINDGFDELNDAFILLDQILKIEPYNVPARFARANFLYQVGKIDIAKSEYTRIKSMLEEMKDKGAIKESLNENISYQNVLKNLDKIRSQNQNP
ncbi:hypothetical protein EHQ58_15130 [Leptospira ognonensis]|uniref:Tetratricopeptide repeat protein n=1 Tax=Leptospira ognonensis TaxID=2484945 RepID=A0A4R9JZF9_9LEPT|nr:hypothetical protein [Leptospira ognonensis]TGL57119.1 hypothetical protein EHQ58_15130 [Leptospira ognonensis]